MPKRHIVVLQDDEAWNLYLREAFEDCASTPQFIRRPEEALPLIRRGNPEVVFAEPALLTKPLVAALHANRASNINFRAFWLNKNPSPSPYPFDGGFEGNPPSLHEFQKSLVETLPLPDPLRILVVDQDPKIREIFQDYFDRRTGPVYIVDTAQDSEEGEEKISQARPHVLVLDPIPFS